MSTPELQPPLYTPKRLSESSDSPKLPSRSSIKSLKVEIHILNEKKVYSPGEEIIGSVSIFQTEKKKINDFLFNDVEIAFQNRLDSKLVKTSKYLFRLDNSPKVDLDHNYSKGFVFNKAVNYPFKFRVPKLQLDNACPLNFEMHRNILPSFGSTPHCGLRFNSKDVNYDADPDDENREIYNRVLEALEFKKFMNVFYITVNININLDNTAKPVSLFQRSKEIQIRNDLNFNETSKSHIGATSRYSLPLSEYYNLFETNALNEIHFHSNLDIIDPMPKLRLGQLKMESALPTLLSANTKTTLPLDLTFKPTYKELIIPNLTVHYELNQYLIQSSKCLKPIGFNPTFLEGLVDSKTFRMDNDDNEIFIMKLQTLFKESAKISNDWVPNYNESETYGNHFQITMPPIVKNKFVQSTFHHCHIQNIYALKVTATYTIEEAKGTAKKEVKKTDIYSSSGVLSGLIKKSRKKSVSNEQQKKEDGSDIDEDQALTLYIPITLL